VACGSFGSAFQARTTLAEAICERALGCRDTFPDEAAFDFAELYGTTEATCLERVGPDPALEGAWDAAEEAGALRYDPDAARACEERVAQVACDGLWSVAEDDPCAAVVEGTLAAEAACTLDAACASGICDQGECR